jgi:hypothetical protein
VTDSSARKVGLTKLVPGYPEADVRWLIPTILWDGDIDRFDDLTVGIYRVHRTHEGLHAGEPNLLVHPRKGIRASRLKGALNLFLALPVDLRLAAYLGFDPNIHSGARSFDNLS